MNKKLAELLENMFKIQKNGKKMIYDLETDEIVEIKNHCQLCEGIESEFNTYEIIKTYPLNSFSLNEKTIIVDMFMRIQQISFQNYINELKQKLLLSNALIDNAQQLSIDQDLLIRPKKETK